MTTIKITRSTTFQELQEAVKDLKIGSITNTLFICRYYKNSTFYRLKEEYNMDSDKIDACKKIRQHILRRGLKCGFAQEDLFAASVWKK